MLDAHPELAIPPETGFLPSLPSSPSPDGSDARRRFFETVTNFPADAPAWPDFGVAEDVFWTHLVGIEPFSVQEGIRCFYRTYAARFGKERWGDKTPTYCLHLATIEALLPEAHFVHVIRDGRDVAESLRRTWFSPGEEIEDLAAYWVHCVSTARRQAEGCPNYLEVRFEDLVGESESVLATICQFLDLEFRPEMLQYFVGAPDRLSEHRDRLRRDGTVVVSREGRLRQQEQTMRPPEPRRVRAWRQAMSDHERRQFEHVAGALLHELGY
jgi:hypothetical protein